MVVDILVATLLVEAAIAGALGVWLLLRYVVRLRRTDKATRRFVPVQSPSDIFALNEALKNGDPLPSNWQQEPPEVDDA